MHYYPDTIAIGPLKRACRRFLTIFVMISISLNLVSCYTLSNYKPDVRQEAPSSTPSTSEPYESSENIGLNAYALFINILRFPLAVFMGTVEIFARIYAMSN